jgi:DNA-directed RNA polymerase specialized sigma24 family protein
MDKNELLLPLLAKRRDIIGKIASKYSIEESELFNEVYIKAFENFDKICESKFHNWMAVVSRNTAITLLLKRNKLGENSKAPESSLIEDDQIGSPSFAHCMLPYLDKLPLSDKEIIVEIYFKNKKRKELICSGQSLSGVKSKAQRAIAKYRAILEKNCCQDIRLGVLNDILEFSTEGCSLK